MPGVAEKKKQKEIAHFRSVAFEMFSHLDVCVGGGWFRSYPVCVCVFWVWSCGGVGHTQCA